MISRYNYFKFKLEKYLKSVFAVEEVLVEVDEGKDLFNDLNVWHFDEPFKNIKEVNVVNSIFKIAMIISADFRIAIESEVCQLNDMEDGGSESTLIAHYMLTYSIGYMAQ